MEIKQAIDRIRCRIDTASDIAGRGVDGKAFEDMEMAISALEKQMGKKPILYMNEVSGMFVDYADGHGEYKTQMNNWWRCPCCNEVVGQRVIVHKRIHDQRKKKYCENCGQGIDWSDCN